jgi:hypothetical protein
VALDLPVEGRSDGLHFSTDKRSSTYDGDSLEDATAAGAVVMGGSYKQCDACGKRALSIANRCPGCGGEFPANEPPKDDGGLDLGRFLTPKAVATVLGVVAVLGSVRLGRAGQPSEVKAEVESSMVKPDPLDTVRVAAPSAESSVALAAESGSELRVARGVTEVRRARSVKAPLEAVLTPGDTVLADSLEQGWYRVTLEGEVLGYADRSRLAALR